MLVCAGVGGRQRVRGRRAEKCLRLRSKRAAPGAPQECHFHVISVPHGMDRVLRDLATAWDREASRLQLLSPLPFMCTLLASPSHAPLPTSVPVIACGNLEMALRFYTRLLGFCEEWRWGDPLSEVGVERDGTRLYLGLDLERARLAEGVEVTIVTNDIDATYQEHREKGVPFSRDLAPTAWGTREYHANDLSGYVLRFVEATSPARSDDELWDEGVRF